MPLILFDKLPLAKAVYICFQSRIMIRRIFALPFLALAFFARAQEKPLDMKMEFEEYDPPSSLVTDTHHIAKAKFPFVDIHNHQFQMPTMDLNGLIQNMDKMNMAVMTNLSGRGRGSAEHLQNSLQNVKDNFPNRFLVFTNLDFS